MTPDQELCLFMLVIMSPLALLFAPMLPIVYGVWLDAWDMARRRRGQR